MRQDSIRPPRRSAEFFICGGEKPTVTVIRSGRDWTKSWEERRSDAAIVSEARL
jgi:hypothetical protein